MNFKNKLFASSMAVLASVGLMASAVSPIAVFAEETTNNPTNWTETAESDYNKINQGSTTDQGEAKDFTGHSLTTNDKIGGLDKTVDHNGGVSTGAGVAATPAPESERSAETFYQVAEGYTWTIHSLVDFGDSKGINNTSTVTKDNAIKVTRNVIPDGKKLSITLKGDNDYKVHNGNTALTYEVFNAANASGAKLAPSAEVMSVNAGTNTGSTPLTFKLATTDGTAEVAGDYSGTIAYVASIVAQ